MKALVLPNTKAADALSTFVERNPMVDVELPALHHLHLQTDYHNDSILLNKQPKTAIAPMRQPVSYLGKLCTIRDQMRKSITSHTELSFWDLVLLTDELNEVAFDTMDADAVDDHRLLEFALALRELMLLHASYTIGVDEETLKVSHRDRIGYHINGGQQVFLSALDKMLVNV